MEWNTSRQSCKETMTKLKCMHMNTYIIAMVLLGSYSYVAG